MSAGRAGPGSRGGAAQTNPESAAQTNEESAAQNSAEGAAQANAESAATRDAGGATTRGAGSAATRGASGAATRRVALIGGGVRSGKSAFALSLARSLGRRRVFIATAEPFDDEMRARIDAHARERGDEFVTLEEPVALAPRLASLSDVDVVVIDCLTLWLSNLLLRDETEPQIGERIEALARAVESVTPHVVLVSNEVGMGVVPESRLGRLFRDLSGRAHQRLGRSASELYVAVMGAILRLRPGPVAVVGEGEGGR